MSDPSIPLDLDQARISIVVSPIHPPLSEKLATFREPGVEHGQFHLPSNKLIQDVLPGKRKKSRPKRLRVIPLLWAVGALMAILFPPAWSGQRPGLVKRTNHGVNYGLKKRLGGPIILMIPGESNGGGVVQATLTSGNISIPTRRACPTALRVWKLSSPVLAAPSDVKGVDDVEINFCRFDITHLDDVAGIASSVMPSKAEMERTPVQRDGVLVVPLPLGLYTGVTGAQHAVSYSFDDPFIIISAVTPFVCSDPTSSTVD
ncbi:hypothetical protein BDN72DRAFT_863532 [Pluteus cervinus]|uniref:Uncharacterized protein n=1 Tax=Pluteus cervinus TaxID=181527 RepID=A0ACD3A7H9_9AGAR|nr:hypothetical protein BDN72DRAFT_863532 [Pluteus cervinus]